MNTPTPVKILIAGGFAVGKSTFVRAISDIEPLTTEANMTVVAEDLDDLGGLRTKRGTTVAMDFGRVQVADGLVLYLFGTPGQDRFKFMWHELGRGAIGAIVLVDTRRLNESFATLDYMEQTGLPFVVAINAFDGELHHHPTSVREALGVSSQIPLLILDARDRSSAKAGLVCLVKHAMVQLARPVGV